MGVVARRLRRLVAVTASAAVLVTASGQASADGDLVQLVRGSGYQVQEDDSTTTIRVPIEVRPGVSTSDLTVETVDVALGQVEQGGVTEAFVPAIQAPSGSLGPALLVSVHAAGGLRPGTYDLILAVRSRTESWDEQRLNLQITHPAAALQAPSTVQVERVLPLFPWQPPAIEPATVQLRETSGQSRISSVTITQLDASRSGDDVVSGRLRFDHPANVGPRRVVSEPFALDGHFPVGTATGSLQVDAPQLEAPVSVNFEVRTRLSIAWLFLVVAAGLALGAAVRTWLKGRIALQDARVQAGEVVVAVDQELARRKDGEFQASATEIRRDLDQARGRTDPKLISDQTAASRARLQNEIGALADRRAAEKRAFDALMAKLRVGWAVPTSLEDAVAKARTALAAEALRLSEDDVLGARSGREQIASELVRELQGARARWRDDLEPLLTFLGDANQDLDAELLPDRKSLIKQATTALDAAPLRNPSAAPEDVLQAANNAYLAVSQALQRLLSGFRIVARDVALVLRQAPPTDTGAVQSLEEATVALDAMTYADDGLPDGVAPLKLREALQTVQASMREAVLKQGGELDAHQRKAVEEALRAGKYRRAATLMAELVKPQERALGGVEATERFQFPPMPPVEPAGRSGRAREVSGFAFPFLETAASPALAAIRLHSDRRSLLIAQIVQSLLLGIAVLVGAYVLYAPRFVGTGSELAAIFLWAFAIDLTVDSVIAAVRGTRPASSPPTSEA